MLRHECPHVFRGLGGGKVFEEEFQVGLGLDLVGLGGFHQGKEHGAGVGTLGGTGKEPVLPSQSHGTDGVFGSVVVGREQAAFHVAHGPVPLVAGIGHGLPEQALGRNVVDAFIEDGLYRVEDGNGLLPAPLDLFLWPQFFDIVLDLVEQPDEIQYLLGCPMHDLLRGRLLDVDELTTDVGHAADMHDAVRFPEGLVPGVAVGLDVAPVLAQILPGDGARPGRVVAIDHGRPLGVSATEEPQVRRRGIGSPRFLEDLQGGFVHVDDRPGADLRPEHFMERLQRLGHSHGPSGHGMARDVHAQTGKLLGLAVERHGVDELCGDDLRQQARSGHALGDDLRRHGRDAHHRHTLLAVAGRAGVFRADMAFHLHDGRDVVELFRDLFADALEADPAGANLLVLGQVVDDLDARQMVRKRLAPPLGPGVGRDFDDRYVCRFRLCAPDQGQRQDSLVKVFGFLGLGSIQGGLQQGHAVLELAVLLVVIPNQMLEFPDVIGKVFDVSHAWMLSNNTLK